MRSDDRRRMLKLADRVNRLESRVSLLYSLELERNRIRIKKESLKQREQREGYGKDYHEGHEPQGGEEHYNEDYGGTDERL